MLLVEVEEVVLPESESLFGVELSTLFELFEFPELVVVAGVVIFDSLSVFPLPLLFRIDSVSEFLPLFLSFVVGLSSPPG